MIDPLRFLILVDEEITLDLPQPGDEKALFAQIEGCRPYLEEWLAWVPEVKTVKDFKKLIEGSIRVLRQGSGIPLVIRYYGQIVGQVGMHSIYKPYHRGEVACWVAEPFAGRRIAPRSCAALIEYVFRELHFHRIEMRCVPDNTRSSSIPKQLGFTYEGTLKEAALLNGRYVDHDLYRLLEQEWRQPTR